MTIPSDFWHNVSKLGNKEVDNDECWFLPTVLEGVACQMILGPKVPLR
jgi:hypothetical protein